MTCIVGYKDNRGKIFMAGDRMAANTGRYETYPTAHPKVFYKGVSIAEGDGSYTSKMIIGYTTSFRLGQLMEYKLEIPKFKVGESNMSYMVEKFIPSLIDLIDKNYYGKKSDAEK